MSVPPPSPSDAEGSSADRRELMRRTEEELAFSGYSPRTRETYATHVRRFLESVEASGGPPGEAALRSYVVRRVERDGWSRAYVCQCVSALKFFYRRVCPGVADVDALPSFRRAKKLPEVLTRQEVASVLKEASGPGTGRCS